MDVSLILVSYKLTRFLRCTTWALPVASGVN